MIIFATMITFLAGLILHEPLPSLAHNCVSVVGERNTHTPPPGGDHNYPSPASDTQSVCCLQHLGSICGFET